MQAQYFAVAICLLAISTLIFCRKKLLSLGISVTASLFHLSALVMFPVLLGVIVLGKLDEKNERLASLGISAALPVVALLTRGVVPEIVKAVLSGSRFVYYFGSSFDDADFAFDLVLINLALFVGIWIVAWSSRKWERQDAICAALLFQSCALATSLFTGAIPLAYRIAYYFMIAPVVLLEPVARLMPRKLMRWGLGVILVCFALVHFLFLSPGDSDRVIPYRSVFDDATTIEKIEEEIKEIQV